MKILFFAIRSTSATAFTRATSFCATTTHVTDRYWETNLVPDVNHFPLDDFPMKGKNVKHMRYTLADTTYGCHVSEFPPGCRSTFHRHGPGAVIIITQGEGYVVLWRDGEERQRHEFKVGTVYSPNDLMWHGHFNTGKGNMRHFAMRGDSPKYSHDRFRNPAWTMIPMDEDPPIFNASMSRFSKKTVSKRRCRWWKIKQAIGQ